MRPIPRLLHLLFPAVLVAGCQPAERATEQPAAPAKASGPRAIPLPQSPEESLRDFESAKQHPPALLAERDAGGHPLLYYGRVFVRTRMEVKVLDLLAFKHATFPFFDEYDSQQYGTPDDDRYQDGSWEYAIATAIQWNALIKYPGLVSAIELNPRVKAMVHPMHDELTAGRPDGSLNPAILAQHGFTFTAPPRPAAACDRRSQTPSQRGGKLQPRIFGDIVDFFEDVGGGLVDWATDVIKGFGGSLSDVMRAAYDGVDEAIDFLRELGNAGYCALSSKRSNRGSVFVFDNWANQELATPFQGANMTPAAEPMRHTPVRARGGWGGILLTTTTTDAEGVYEFNDLCSDLTYSLSVEVDTPAIWLTKNGFSTDSFDIGTAGPNDAHTRWVVHDHPSANWLIAAQLGRGFVEQKLGFTPEKARVLSGWFADKIIGGISGGVSIATCGQTNLVGGLVPLAAPLLDVDIYAHSSSYRLSVDTAGKNGIGIATHEYGHFAMCQAIKKLGGDFDGYMNSYMWTLFANTSPPADKFQPIRNSAESIADYFSDAVYGFTDYFNNNPGQGGSCPSRGEGHICGTYSKPERGCLAKAGLFQLPSDVNNPEHHCEWIASRTAVMHDITAGADVPPPQRTGLAVGVPPHGLYQAMAAVGRNLTTQSMVRWLSEVPAYGRPAEGLCRVLRAHNWDCNAVDSAGVMLDAPANLTAYGLSATEIAWIYAPTSALANSYALLNSAGNDVREIAVVGRDKFRIVQRLPPGTVGNQRVVGVVEARRDGARPGRSTRVVGCTLASPVGSLSAAQSSVGAKLTWTGAGADGYVIKRANGSGDFTPIAHLAAGGSANVFEDAEVAPGLSYRYKVAALNCSGQETDSNEVSLAIDFNDVNYLYVSVNAPAGGNGTRAYPLRTLNEATERLAATRSQIVVSGGTYPECVYAFGYDVSIYGGYDPAFRTYAPERYETKLIGGGNECRHNVGIKEFPEYVAAIVVGSRSVTLAGITAAPGERSCAGSECIRLGLAVAAGGQLNVSRVRYKSGGGDGSMLRLSGVRCQAYSCVVTVANSQLEELSAKDGSGVPAVEGQNVIIQGSTVVTQDGTAVLAQNATIDGSILRGNAVHWMSDKSTGLDAFCGTVTNSLIAGGRALRLGDRTPSFFGTIPPACLNKLANSLIYGQTWVINTQLINNIFMSQQTLSASDPVLYYDSNKGSTDVQVTGQIVRNNLFMPLGMPLGVVATAQRRNSGLGLLSSSQINDPTAWFRASANDVACNQLSGNLDAVFGSDRLSQPVGPSLRPLSGSVAVGQGISPSRIGLSIPRDLLGVDRSSEEFDIGPYALSSH